jgi:nitrogen fixation NifU-like protein
MYSQKVLEHFLEPQNVGTIEDAEGFGKSSGGPGCPEDVAYLWIRVAGDRIVEVKHKTLGCPVAIASSSITSVLAEGNTLTEALQITEETVVQALGGVPEHKVDSIVAVEALHQAIADCQAKRDG